MGKVYRVHDLKIVSIGIFMQKIEFWTNFVTNFTLIRYSYSISTNADILVFHIQVSTLRYGGIADD